MQDFIVTKRAANGEREEVQYTAADRAALFSQLKAEGVNAISVREGKLDPRKARKPSRKPTSAPSKPRSPMRGLLAGLIVIVGAAAIYYFFLMPKPQQVETVSDKKQELIKEVAPAVVTNVAETSGSSGKTDGADTSAADSLPPEKRIVAMISVRTNEDGSVIERFRTADGKVRSRQSAPKSIFKCASDQLLAMAMSGAESGGSMPPMPTGGVSNEQFLESLKTEIVITEEDSDKDKALKLSVIDARRQMKEMIENGQSFQDVINDHEKLVNDNAAIRANAEAELQQIFESGDKAGVRKYLIIMNAALQQMGIKELDEPISREEKRRQILERRANKQPTEGTSK